MSPIFYWTPNSGVFSTTVLEVNSSGDENDDDKEERSEREGGGGNDNNKGEGHGIVIDNYSDNHAGVNALTHSRQHLVHHLTVVVRSKPGPHHP